MAEFTPLEVAKLKEERNLTNDQIVFLQRIIKQFSTKITKEELINTYRKLGYNSKIMETDLNLKFGDKKDKPIKITYDLLPNGKIENFEAQ
jgi:uncharacterized protein YktA (UPF0223 family)